MKNTKRVLLLTGSPRKNGNSSAMADAFVKRAELDGHQICRFDTAHMQVNGCDVCEKCFQDGSPCRMNDEFNQIASGFEWADAVVFATPVYWYSMPAQLKAVIDKMYAFLVCGRCNHIMEKECVLLACCEENDLSVFDGVRFIYERMAAQLNWYSLGEVLIPGVLNEGDIRKTDGEPLAEQMAIQLNNKNLRRKSHG